MATPAAVLSVLITAKGFAQVSQDLNKVEREMKRTSDSTDKIEKRFSHLDNTVGDFNRTMMGLRNVVGLVKWPAIIAGAGGAAQAVGALAAGAVSLASALAPLAGAGAAAAVGFSALGQAAGVGKLALGDIQKALGGNKKALEALTPTQRAFVDRLKSMRGEFKALQEAAAQGMAPGLNAALKSLTPLLSTLRPIIAGTARAMGDLAAAGGRMVGSWGKDFTAVGKTNITIIRNIGTAALSAASALKDIVVVAGPLATWMSEMVKQGAAWVASQIKAGRESGRLAGFLKQTRDVMTTLGHIIGNLVVGLFNIGKAAAPLGREMLSSFEKLTAKFREWTQSAQGKNSMAQYFRDARGPLYSLFHLVGDLSGAIGRLMRPTPMTSGMLESLRNLVPVLEGVIRTTTAAFGPTIVAALTQVVRLIGQLAGASGPLTLTVKAIGWMAGALADLLKNVPGLQIIAVTLFGLATSGKLLGIIFKPLLGTLGLLASGWSKVGGSSLIAIKNQTGATAAAERSGTIGAAAVERLAAAWGGVNGAAGRATVAQSIAGKSSAFSLAGAPGTKAASSQAFTLAGAPGISASAEKATVSRFQALTSKLSAAGAIAMRGAGVTLGGIFATSLASTLVPAASKAITAIGTGASIGGGLGMLFGPWGAAAGAALGAGLGAALTLFKSHAPEEGRKWSAAFSQGISINISTPDARTLQTRLAQLDDQLRRQGHNLKIELDLPSNVKPSVIAAAQARLNATAQAMARTAAQQFELAWNNTPLKGTSAFIQSAIGQLQQLPAIVRGGAAQAMLAYATQLQSSGQLPKGAVQQLIAAMKSQVDGLPAYFAQRGLATDRALAQAAQFTAARAQLTTTLQGIQSQFNLSWIQVANNTRQLPKAFADTWTALIALSRDKSPQVRDAATRALEQLRVQGTRSFSLMSQDAGRIMDALRTKVQTTSGASRDAAQTAFNQMRSRVNQAFNDQAGHVWNKMEEARHAVSSKSTAAKNEASSAFGQLAHNVGVAMDSGAISVQRGTQIIAKTLNKQLKAFGVAQVAGATVAGIERVVAGAVNFGGKARGGFVERFAGGGLMQIGRPGQAGHDTIPMNVGGQPIAVGAGEQVAVFNRHQQAVMNSALAPMGGLQGMFAKVNRPHYMASGGMVPGYANGGIIGQSAIEDLWKRAGGNPSQALLMSAIAEAESGGDPRAHNPSGATGLWQIMMPMNASYVPGGNANDPLSNAIAAVRILRAQGLSAWEAYTNGSYAKFMHGLVGGAGAGTAGSALWKDLKVPQVAGGGTVAELVRAGLGKAVDAANAYGRAHMPAAAAAAASAGVGTLPPGAGQAQVSAAMLAAARHILGRPYIYGGGHGAWESPGYDCSGAVSYILHAAGLLASPMDTTALANWGLPGGGKYITVGVRGGAGMSGHTMMSFFGHFFESGGSGGGPHWDSGWDGVFPISRHPKGFARGGSVSGDFGDVPPQQLLATNPNVAKDPRFAAYQKTFGKRRKFTKGGLIPSFAAGGLPFSGRVSWFNDSSTASGKSAATTAGLSLRLPNSEATAAVNRALLGKLFMLQLSGRRATLPDIDLGPASWTNRNIDVSVPALKKMGWTTSTFPTDAVGTITDPSGTSKRGGATSTAGKTTTAITKKAAPFKPTTVPKLKLPFKLPKGLDDLVQSVSYRLTRGPAFGEPARGLVPVIAQNLPVFDQLINEMTSILDPAAGRVAVLNDLVSSKGRVYDQLDSEYATAHPGLDTATGIYPADSSTNTPAREDATFTAMRRDQLKRLADWQAEVVAKLKRARQVIDMLIPRLQKAIDIRNKQIAAVQEYIRNNQATIQSYRYLLGLLPNTTKALTAKDHSKVDGLAKLLANETRGSMRSNLLGVLRSGVTGQRARSNVSANITALQDQNKQLSGTGGIIDVLGGPSGQISVLQERIKTASDNRAQIVGPSGEGGTLLDAQLTLNDFLDQLKPFDPGAVAAAIAASNATLTGPGTTAADNSQALADLAEQNRLQGILNTQLRQQLAVSEAQGKVFANATDLFPFIGKFAAGGTWPQTGWGLVGEHGPELALLPGGSKILNNNQTSQIGVQPTIVVQVLDGAVDAKRIRVLAGDEAQAAIRGSSRSGGRILPGGAR